MTEHKTHSQQAEKWLAHADSTNSADAAQYAVSRAQVHATLCLAEQVARLGKDPDATDN